MRYNIDSGLSVTSGHPWPKCPVHVLCCAAGQPSLATSWRMACTPYIMSGSDQQTLTVTAQPLCSGHPTALSMPRLPRDHFRRLHRCCNEDPARRDRAGRFSVSTESNMAIIISSLGYFNLQADVHSPKLPQTKLLRLCSWHV